MLFTTRVLLCLAVGARHILADIEGSPDASQPQVGVEMGDPGEVQ
jgi:hypothetical protein